MPTVACRPAEWQLYNSNTKADTDTQRIQKIGKHTKNHDMYLYGNCRGLAKLTRSNAAGTAHALVSIVLARPPTDSPPCLGFSAHAHPLKQDTSPSGTGHSRSSLSSTTPSYFFTLRSRPRSPVPTACGGTAPDRSRLEERSPAPHSLRSPAQRLSSLALAWTHSLAGAHARRAGSGTAGDESDEARPAWARRPTGAGTSNSWTNSPASSAQQLHCNTRRNSL